MLHISILKAENPFCLWGRIVKGPGIEPESPKAYEDLQVKMNLFYHEVNQDVQKIKPSSIHEGQVCVVYVSGLKNWCRAIVESLFLGTVGGQAMCFLVDHGEHTVVCSDEVRAPLEKFLQLPFWVRKFQLAGIQPVRLQVSIYEDKAELVPSNQWDSSATRYLHNLLQASNQMEAVLCETQADSTFIELYLTIRNVKICVNDDLVTKRFACFPSGKSHSPAQNGVVDRPPAFLTCDIYSDMESFLATNGCTIRSLSPLVSPRHPAVTKVTNQRPVITSGQVALQTSNGASQGQGKVRKLSEGGGINQKEAHHPELDSDEGHHGLREDTQDTDISLVANLLKNLNRVRFLTFLNPASSAQRPVPNTDLEEENEEDDVHGISGAKDEEELVGATQQTVDETAGWCAEPQPYQIMDRSIGHWQEGSPSRKTELPFSKATSNVPRSHLMLNLTEMLRQKPDTERKPVRIRPPSPRAPPPKELQFNKGLSCEPMPKPIIRRRSHSLPSTSERKRHSRSVGVRFVDSLGLDLEDVNIFKTGEDPFVPQHVTFRLLMGAELAGGKNLEISLPYFRPVFLQQPGDQLDFLNRLCHQRVCLERVLCFELGIIGITQVLNIDFEKDVSVHYSFTDWKSCTVTKASWVSTIAKAWDGIEGQLSCDTFRFHLPVPPFLKPGAVLEFAIRYQTCGTEYWDNNDWQNYKLVCHNYKLTVPKECEDSMVHFI